MFKQSRGIMQLRSITNSSTVKENYAINVLCIDKFTQTVTLREKKIQHGTDWIQWGRESFNLIQAAEEFTFYKSTFMLKH